MYCTTTSASRREKGKAPSFNPFIRGHFNFARGSALSEGNGRASGTQWAGHQDFEPHERMRDKHHLVHLEVECRA